MSNLTTVVNSIVSKVNTHTTDLSNKATQISTHIPLSGTTAYHLLQGNLAVSASTITQGFNTTLYTGNGSTQSITTGIDMSTQWGNTAEEKFGGLVWIKGRSSATGHNLLDSTRNNFDQVIYSHSTSAGISANVIDVTNNGFSVNTTSDVNTSLVTYASWNFQTTHRTSGVTNHGKAYTCHFNPFTGFTMVKYEGSGLAGHEIPHHLGRKLGFVTHKNLSAVTNWASIEYINGSNGFFNLTNAFALGIIPQTDDVIGLSTDGNTNASTNQYILYGWANSYFDKANKLIGNYEVGIYQGTGASGNKVTTRGKPAWVMIKRLDSTGGNWRIFDNQRPYTLFPSVPTAETNESNKPTFNSDGFIVNTTTDIEDNASGGQYLYLVAYDTNSNGGGSYYPLASDTSNLQIQNAIIPFANGVDTNGTKITTLSKNETISGLTLTAGKNYVYSKNDGTYGVSKFAPQYNSYNGFGDYFDVASNKWYSGVSVFSDTCDITTNWTADEALGGAASTISSVNGELKIVNNGATYGAARTSITTIVGKKYKLVYSLTSNSSGTANFWVGSTLRGQDLGTNPQASAGTYSITFTASTSTTYLMAFNQNNSGAISTWDNIAVYPIKDDGTQDLSNATAITTSRNYLNHIVYADNDGGVLYVEELPKIEYKDIVKANELKGKNACTAWVNFDGTTTPPTIRDSYNVKSVIRTATGIFDVYFEEEMNNVNYDAVSDIKRVGTWVNSGSQTHLYNTHKLTIQCVENNVSTNSDLCKVIVFGGKN